MTNAIIGFFLMLAIPLLVVFLAYIFIFNIVKTDTNVNASDFLNITCFDEVDLEISLIKP